MAARSLEDMLIQSWGDYIRVFPAVPDEWKELVFNDLRTEGAFLVSASRKGGTTQWVRIKSLAGEPCKIRPSMEGDIRIVRDGQTVRKRITKDEVVKIELETGEEAIIYAETNVPNLTISPVPINDEANSWGVKAE